MRTDQHLEQKGTFDECWQNSDVVLVAEEKELHVHSTILSLASPVFDKMLNGNFKEAQSKKVHLQGKSFQLVEHMLKLIYPTIDEKIGTRRDLCGNCSLESENQLIRIACTNCRQNEGNSGLCDICVKPNSTRCSQCYQYFIKSIQQKQQSVDDMRKLLGISQEYMLSAIEQKIYNELIKESQLLLVVGNVQFAVILLTFADEVECGEAVNLCLRYIAEHLKIPSVLDELKLKHVPDVPEDPWNSLMRNEKLSVDVKTKLMGLIIKRNVKDLINTDGGGGCNLGKTRVELNRIANELIYFKLQSEVKAIGIHGV